MYEYNKYPFFRESYKLLQSLAYLPEEDVIVGFLCLKKLTDPNFEQTLDYVEKNYIGI